MSSWVLQTFAATKASLGLANKSSLKLQGFTVGAPHCHNTTVVMSPDIVNKVVDEAGYRIVKSNMDMDPRDREKNLYYSRDILFLMQPDCSEWAN